MKEKTQVNKLSKVIYFDENSATDYVQIIEGGELAQTTELLSVGGTSGDTEIGTKVSFGFGKLFRSLVGLDASASIEANLRANFQDEKLVKNILQNTILTDFLNIVEGNLKSDTKTTGIQLIEDYKIEVIENTLSYIIMFSSFMTMFKDGSSIKMAKGYFEFIGNHKEKPQIVLRFNIDAFKNNYKISDLLKMDLMLYAIRVGKTTIDKMDFITELNSFGKSKNNQFSNPEFGVDLEVSEKNQEPELNVYDVILAGIREE